MNLLEKVHWPEVAQRLCSVIPLQELHLGVMDFLRKNLTEPWGICCSGGADSLSLLLLMAGYFPDKRDIYVLHYNHRLRGEESDAEAEFVDHCAEGLGLPFILGERDRFIENKNEAIFREMRHEFFNDSLKKINGSILLFGHHCNDVAETMLMRIARGSGTGGLCAPRPIHLFANKVHLRPCINITKERLLFALEEVGVSWCYDSSNSKEDYFRNRVRLNVMPNWINAATGNFWKGIQHSRELLEEDDLALEQCVEILFKKEAIQRGVPLNLDLLIGMPKALYRRAIYRWLLVHNIGDNISTQNFAFILEKAMAGSETRAFINEDDCIILRNNKIYLNSTIFSSISPIIFEKKALILNSSILLPNHKTLYAEEVVLSSELKNTIFGGKINPRHCVYIRYDMENAFELYIRTWQAGDRYRALGAPGSRKLQDMFVDRKIAYELRHSLPVICDKNMGIVWCPGLPIADAFRIEDKTCNALKLTFT